MAKGACASKRDVLELSTLRKLVEKLLTPQPTTFYEVKTDAHYRRPKEKLSLNTVFCFLRKMRCEPFLGMQYKFKYKRFFYSFLSFKLHNQLLSMKSKLMLTQEKS